MNQELKEFVDYNEEQIDDNKGLDKQIFRKYSDNTSLGSKDHIIDVNNNLSLRDIMSEP